MPLSLCATLEKGNTVFPLPRSWERWVQYVSGIVPCVCFQYLVVVVVVVIIIIFLALVLSLA